MTKEIIAQLRAKKISPFNLDEVADCIEKLEQQLAEHEKQIVMLRELDRQVAELKKQLIDMTVKRDIDEWYPVYHSYRSDKCGKISID
jgi:DNA-binding transcriptional MerR regulator